VPSLQPQTVTTGTINGSGVDMQLTDGPCHAVISVGAVTGVYTALQATIQESDDNTTFVAMTENPQTIAVMAANTTYVLSFWKRAKRYLRVQLTATGGTNALVSALLLSRKDITGTGGGAWTTTP
jgi:hypothetical protein